jgi:hypothetical protein
VAIAAGVAVFLTVERASSEVATTQYEYRASWLALASPEPISVEVENESWARLITFRPERACVLATPLTESGKSKPRLDAGKVMVVMKDRQGIRFTAERWRSPRQSMARFRCR